MDGEVRDIVDITLDRIRFYEPSDGYYLAFSGGKDSVVVKALLDMAGVKYDAHYNLTTVDPPELVRFIKDVHPDVEIHRPKKSMWELIRGRGFPPNRQVRYCCGELKERGGKGRVVVTGVRWAESVRRSNTPIIQYAHDSRSKKVAKAREIFLNLGDDGERRRMVEACIKRKHVFNPIIDWMDDDVWSFIRKHEIPYCSLYDEGFKRLGCIGCPLTSERQKNKEFMRWPKYQAQYIRVFDEIVEAGHREGRYIQYKDGVDMFVDWVRRGRTSYYPEGWNDENQ